MKNVWLYILLIFIIILCLYSSNNNNYENFTPYMRKLYRPHIRNARLLSENIYTKYKNNVIILLRKYNIL
jgi:uncharacterized protein YxeA